MTAINPPFVIQAGSHPADLFRRALAGLVPPDDSVPASTDMIVSANSPAGMSVVVSAGGAFVKGDSRESQGHYYVYNDAPEVLAIGASNATYTRRDLIIARVYDNTEDGSGRNEWALEVVAGVASAEAAEPALPISAVKLAVVTVWAGSSSIFPGHVKDARNVSGPPYAPAASKEGGLLKQKIRTAGPYWLSTTTWSNLDIALDISLPAKVGDWIEAGLSYFAGIQSPDVYFDVVTIENTIMRNSFATKGPLPSNVHRGVSAWAAAGGARASVGGSVPYQLKAEDVGGGQVYLRIRRRNSTSTQRVIGAEPNIPFEFWARNLG